LNPKNKLRKGLISYYKTNGITCLQKHLDVDHFVIFKNKKLIVKGGKILNNNLQKKELIFLILPYLNFCFKRTLQKG
jgi:hypothetical protein